MAIGVAMVNGDSSRARHIAQVWSAVAILCLPFGWAVDVSLPVDYWAGVFAGAYGILASPLVALAVALVWWPVRALAASARNPRRPRSAGS
ncbi:hypothetical protein GCM10022243_03800 [Saccharothrix violaceirubra]|uniref:Uncharacterized protein n=1 Tax=Saccharothrix violaceirubra TaxID=413306 RepID=A0A7W7WUR6_9PSEU|nr:hypothetical protein [Saccharothrix violaceirubra]MBB4964127.1 hypothetical protein [Saccharothrix violaceirubra]